MAHKVETGPKILYGGDPAVVAWLDAMGIDIPWQRVIIDIQVEKPARIYVEALGSAQMLQIKPPDLRGAEITTQADEQAENPEPLEAEDLAPPVGSTAVELPRDIVSPWVELPAEGAAVEFPIPLATIDDIVCRNTPQDGPFSKIKMPDARRRFRFSVDAFILAYDPPQPAPGGDRGPTWYLRPSGKPTLEELPAVVPKPPHA